MLNIQGALLTVKEFYSLYVFLHPNCRGYEVRYAHFKAKHGRAPETKAERDLNGSLTSCHAGGGLARAKAGQGRYNVSRKEDQVLLKDFHCCLPADAWGCGLCYHRGRRKPPTFTLTALGRKYVERAIEKFFAIGVNPLGLL